MNKSDIGPYAIVPQWLLEEVGSGALSLFVALALHADRTTDEAWPSRKRLGEMLGVSVDTVDRYMAELVEAGAVVKEPRVDDGGGQHSNRYLVAYVRRGVEAGAAHPSRSGAAQNQNQLEPEPRTSIAPTASTRPRDDVWDALVAIYGQPTASGKGAMNAAAKVLRDFGADPAEMTWMVTVLRRTDLSWAVTTPNALAKHFGERHALVAELDKKPFDRAAAIANGDLGG